jgi:hypothetical protein
MATGLVLSSMSSADAHRRSYRGAYVAGGAAAAIVGLGLLGAYASRPAYGGYYSYSSPGCYRGPERCGWTGRRCWENRYGEYVCRGGTWRCYRPTYCD